MPANQTYHRNRARNEQAMAASADTKMARTIHLNLARLHLDQLEIAPSAHVPVVV